MKKIYLRDLQLYDAEALYTMCSDEESQKNGISYYNSSKDAQKTIHVWKHISYDNLFNKAIVESTTDKMVGWISLGDMNRYHGYYELEYAISKEHRNKGYATQAVYDMLAFAFDQCKAEVVAAWVRSHNLSSARVLEKCGFVFEGKLRKHARDKSDTLCYSITPEDWNDYGKAR